MEMLDKMEALLYLGTFNRNVGAKAREDYVELRELHPVKEEELREALRERIKKLESNMGRNIEIHTLIRYKQELETLNNI